MFGVILFGIVFASLSSDVMCNLPVVSEVLEEGFCLRDIDDWESVEEGRVRDATVDKFERCFLCGRVLVRVDSEFNCREAFGPVVLSKVDKVSHHLNDKAVHSFGRSISLGMKGSRHSKSNFEDFHNNFVEFGIDAGVSVTND